MKTIGLTGGIGSGKSAVANYFAALGTPIIDADTIGHQLVAKGMPALEQIKLEFGDAIVDHQGNLNRAKMRALVFTPDHQANDFKKKLEAILHPLIYQEITNQIHTLKKNKNPPPYCIIVIPLLAEKWALFQNLIDLVLVVDAPESLQLSRVLERAKNEHLTQDQALAIIYNQISREERLKMAHTVISNSGDLEDLQKAIIHLHTLWHNI